MSVDTFELGDELPTGYQRDITLYATKYKQGGRKVFAIDLSLEDIRDLLPEPNPDQPTEGNRRVDAKHASGFATYLRENEDWVAPALILRSPDIFDFERKAAVNGTEFGVIRFPRNAQDDLRILDGQHRTLGIHLALKGIAEDLAQARSHLSAAERNGSDPAEIAHFEQIVRRLQMERNRLTGDRTSVQIYIEDDSQRYKQMFSDIADNARGIKTSVKTLFDSRKVVHRAVPSVMEHPLLAGRVDMEEDRLGRKNQNLLGAKHVADIIRAVAVGIQGRVSTRQEKELSEDDLADRTRAFLDALTLGFAPLSQIVDEDLTPQELRSTSMLGSTTVLRILAGVFHDLTTRSEDALDDEDVAEFFTQLAPHMDAPVAKDSIWVKHVPSEAIVEGASAPLARRQDLKELNDLLVSWADDAPGWL